MFHSQRCLADHDGSVNELFERNEKVLKFLAIWSPCSVSGSVAGVSHHSEDLMLCGTDETTVPQRQELLF